MCSTEDTSIFELELLKVFVLDVFDLVVFDEEVAVLSRQDSGVLVDSLIVQLVRIRRRDGCLAQGILLLLGNVDVVDCSLQVSLLWLLLSGLSTSLRLPLLHQKYLLLLSLAELERFKRRQSLLVSAIQLEHLMVH